jgi:SCY1-like protein 1
LASVVVTQTLDWKLHAFDVLSEFDANNEAAGSPMLVMTLNPPLYGTKYSFPF